MKRLPALLTLALALALNACGGSSSEGQMTGNSSAQSARVMSQIARAAPATIATKTFPKTINSYQITKTASGYSITSIADASDVSTISTNSGASLLKFADAAIILGDAEGNAGKIYRLYQAAFARTPDLGGVSFWIDQLNNGASLLQISQQFQASAEFKSLYGSAVSNTSFVTLLYQNVLHRVPDQGGLAFWINLLETQQSSRDNVLIAFSESAENKEQVAAAIDNGIAYQIAETSLAKRYPGDANIGNDPDVLFSEMAEEANVSALLANWNASSSGNSVAIDTTSWPANSPGKQSLRLTTTAGTQGVGAIRSAGLYKYFAGGYDGTIYARWYVKYNATGTFHHSGPRLGGNNPGSPNLPMSLAGVRPNGADFFYLGAELSGAKAAPTQSATFDFYNYWMNQRGTSFFPGQYYGNSFINSPSVALDMTSWNCIEVQLSLNDPVNGSNGEIAMWINGVEVSRVKAGTLGTWTEDHFQANAAGTPFEGFQWRNDANLKFNYFQLLHFVDHDPDGMTNSVNYDHIVIARKYIGPLQ